MKKFLLFIFISINANVFYSQVSEISLKNFCPSKESQEGAICFAYATTYTALSIEYNIKENIQNENSPKFNSFSYGFVASKVKHNKNFIGKLFNRCGRNATAELALQVLQDYGTVSLKTFPEKCKVQKAIQLLDIAAQHKIEKFEMIGSIDMDDNAHIIKIKENLTKQKPVINTILQESFFLNSSDLEDIIFPNDYKKHPQYANHVVAVIGFDDNRNGGSFLIKNNYIDWGVNGFAYIKYSDYIKLVRESYIIYI